MHGGQNFRRFGTLVISRYMDLASSCCLISCVLTGFILFSSNIARAADLEDFMELVETCGGCHGEQGISEIPEFPSSAMQKAGYLEPTLFDFRSGERPTETMFYFVEELTDEEIKGLAEYYSQLKRCK